MAKKIDSVDLFFIRLFQNGWFYLLCSLVTAGIFIWAIQPSWEEKNKREIMKEINLIHQGISEEPISSYERWQKLQATIRGQKIKSEHLRTSLKQAGEDVDRIYPQIKEQLELRDRERIAAETARNTAKRIEEQNLTIAKREAEQREALAKKYRNVSPSVKQALAALKRLEAFTEVGVNKIKYAEALGESWGDIKVFMESPEGRTDYPELSLLFAEAIDFYKMAGDSWDKDRKYTVQGYWADASAKVREIDQLLNQ